MEIVITGETDRNVVPGQLPHPSVVQKPPQHQHRLLAHRQRPGIGAGTPARRTAASSPARKSTISSHTGGTSVYVTLIVDAEPL
jgi:hypothetical protein